MSRYIQVTTTLPSEEEARELARALIDRRLAACVQWSGPVTSVYSWEGKVEESQEWTCTAKTRSSALEELVTVITQLHSYEVPEIIATPIVDIAPSYARWIDQQVDRT